MVVANGSNPGKMVVWRDQDFWASPQLTPSHRRPKTASPKPNGVNHADALRVARESSFNFFVLATPDRELITCLLLYIFVATCGE